LESWKNKLGIKVIKTEKNRESRYPGS